MNRKNSGYPQRRSIRLAGYDYTKNGAYFVTLCVQNRLHLFGEISDGRMNLNEAGWMAERIWNQIPEHYSEFHIEAVQIMPNHLHGILMIIDDDGRPQEYGNGRTRGSAPTERLALGDVVQRFKMLTTKLYIDGVNKSNWKPFTLRLWQRNYWEHVIRNERELYAYQEYILNNPLQWHFDELNK